MSEIIIYDECGRIKPNNFKSLRRSLRRNRRIPKFTRTFSNPNYLNPFPNIVERRLKKMGKYKFKVGDKLVCNEENGSGYFKVGDKVVVTKLRDLLDERETMEVSGANKENRHVYCEYFSLVEEKTPSKNVDMTKKKIYNVLIVDKKTGKTIKDEKVVAGNEQQAILKTFGVDAENTFIKTEEIGEYEEEKPLKAIIVKAEVTEKPKKKE